MCESIKKSINQPGMVVNPARGMNGHHIHSKGKGQPGKVANPAHGQLNRKN